MQSTETESLAPGRLPDRVGWQVAIRVLDQLSTEDLMGMLDVEWPKDGECLWTDAAGWLVYRRVGATQASENKGAGERA